MPFSLSAASAALALLTSTALAQAVYRCEGDDGEPVFSNLHCGGAATPVELGGNRVMEGSVDLNKAQRQLKQVQNLPEIRREARKKRTSRRMGFGERMELRRLRIRAEGLRRDLRVPRSETSRGSLERELRDVSRRIRKLEQMER